MTQFNINLDGIDKSIKSLTASVCSWNTLSAAPSSAKNRAVLSAPAEAMRLPSGLNVASSTQDVWPVIVMWRLPDDLRKKLAFEKRLKETYCFFYCFLSQVSQRVTWSLDPMTKPPL